MIRPPAPGDESALADLFASFDGSHFHPHALTPEAAADRCAYTGLDVYLVAWKGSRAVAYGMLRGWDEGYVVPSLGVAVHPRYQGRGHGREMMLALHDAAQQRGATQIRLRVAHDNDRAYRLYRSLGYQDAGEERGERLMLVRL